MNKELKSDCIKVRITPSEKINIEKEASEKCDKNVSEYIRQRIRQSADISITQKELDEVRRKISYEINRIGNNINQIAHHYNAYGLDEISDELIDDMEELKEILSDIDNKLKRT